ncbi:hypothetical protein ACIP5Z_01735 [Rothia terrae]|uniref:hypothetical protein n=1 Tax=Rothia terrae TaxID=396015 RepID=UPI003813AC00
MAETSFPVLELPLNDQQWKSVTLGIGDGVLDEGGDPYRLSNAENVGNTVRINVDSKKGYSHAILKGFYHKIDSYMVVTVPAVTAPTTYYIALVYDPLNKSKPVALKVVTALDRTSGKEYLLLHKVERAANQLLTDAKFTKYIQKITPSIQVDYPDGLPEASSVLFGTKAYCLYTGETFRAAFNNQWERTGSTRRDLIPVPSWRTSSATNGIIVTPVNDGYQCTATISIVRTGVGYAVPPNYTDPGGGVVSTLGLFIPADLRPISGSFQPVLIGNRIFECWLNTDGQIRIKTTTNTNERIETGQGISFSFTWYTTK